MSFHSAVELEDYLDDEVRIQKGDIGMSNKSELRTNFPGLTSDWDDLHSHPWANNDGWIDRRRFPSISLPHPWEPPYNPALKYPYPMLFPPYSNRHPGTPITL